MPNPAPPLWKKWPVLFLGLGACLSVAWVLWLPFGAAHDFSVALASNNTAAVREMVDSKAIENQRLRHYLGKINTERAAGATDGPLFVMGDSMAELMAERFAWEEAQVSRWKPTAQEANGEWQRGYDGLGRFRTWAGEDRVWILERKGFGWQISAIETP